MTEPTGQTQTPAADDRPAFPALSRTRSSVEDGTPRSTGRTRLCNIAIYSVLTFALIFAVGRVYTDKTNIPQQVAARQLVKALVAEGATADPDGERARYLAPGSLARAANLDASWRIGWLPSSAADTVLANRDDMVLACALLTSEPGSGWFCSDGLETFPAPTPPEEFLGPQIV